MAEIARVKMAEIEATKESHVSSDIPPTIPPVEVTTNSNVSTILGKSECSDNKVTTSPSDCPEVQTGNSAGSELSSHPSPLEVNTSLETTKTGIKLQDKIVDDPAPDTAMKRHNPSHPSSFGMDPCSESPHSTTLCDRSTPDILGNRGASLVSYDFVPNCKGVTENHSFQPRPDEQVTVADAQQSNETTMTSDVPTSSECDSYQTTTSPEERKRVAKIGRRQRAKV